MAEKLTVHRIMNSVIVQDALQLAEGMLLHQPGETRPGMLRGRVKLASDTQRVESLKLALAAFKAERNADAIGLFETAIAEGVYGAPIHFFLGLLFWLGSNHGRAVAELELASNSEDLKLAVHLCLGAIYDAEGNLDKSIRQLIVALVRVENALSDQSEHDEILQQYMRLASELTNASSSDEGMAYIGGALELLTSRRWETRVQETRAAVRRGVEGNGYGIIGAKLVSGSRVLNEAIGLSANLLKNGMPYSALEEAYRAIELAPDYLPAHTHVAEILAEEGRRRSAAEKHRTIADTYIVRGEAKDGLSAYERSLSLTPHDVELREKVLKLQLDKGDMESSLNHYQQLGRTYHLMADDVRSLEYYSRGLELADNSPVKGAWRFAFLGAIAKIGLAAGDHQAAVSALQEMRSLNPDDETTFKDLVSALLVTGQGDQAMDEVRRMALAERGEFGRSAAILQELFDEHPRSDALATALADMYDKAGQQNSAAKILEGLLKRRLEDGEIEQARDTAAAIIELSPGDKNRIQDMMQRYSAD